MSVPFVSDITGETVMHRTRHSVAAWGLVILVSMTAIGGCSGSENRLRYEILFDPNGTERSSPSSDLHGRLLLADDPSRKLLISRLAKVISGPRSHSQVVALRGLLKFFNLDPEYYTPEISRAIAHTAIRIADCPSFKTYYDLERLTNEKLRVKEELKLRVSPRCSVWLDGRYYTVFSRPDDSDSGLPRGWKADEGLIAVDGRPVAYHPAEWGLWLHNRVHPEMTIDLKKALREGGQLEGEHLISSGLRLTSPDGTEICIEGHVTLIVARGIQGDGIDYFPKKSDREGEAEPDHE